MMRTNEIILSAKIVQLVSSEQQCSSAASRIVSRRLSFFLININNACEGKEHSEVPIAARVFSSAKVAGINRVEIKQLANIMTTFLLKHSLEISALVECVFFILNSELHLKKFSREGRLSS